MPTKTPIFDAGKAKLTIDKGKRAKWWKRKGSMARGFYYLDSTGQRVSNDEALDRIRRLVVPPAWRHVRIAPASGSSLQAVGMDTTGRVQYLYHVRFAERQQRKKFSRIEVFGTYLPQLRSETNQHIMLDGFPREKVLAVMIRLINSLYFRVGTEKSVKHYKTFGITTLQNRHLQLGRKGELIFEFIGKSHVKHRQVLVDDELASVMREIKTLGRARKLFHYIGEDGKPHGILPADLNDYLKTATAPDYSAKDLRTWGGTLLAAIHLAEIGTTDNEAQIKKNILKAVKKVSEQLGNTPAVCRGSYIHPAIIKSYEAGMTIDEFRPKKQRRIKRLESDYEPEELALLKLLNVNSSKVI